ncbi:hypothetical protein FLP41_11320 [Paracoccus marcusii]|uniref:hypothetical protein n=1 Tax=Paracoccus marcusii TaxID=59779 RepID=UPI002ED38545|nr:hypothetical protein FLP41_11320 [Paracoccus marcusii]
MGGSRAGRGLPIGERLPQRSVATLADTGVVAQRAADGTDRGAGCQVFVQGLRDDGTGNGTACGALRVGEMPPP